MKKISAILTAALIFACLASVCASADDMIDITTYAPIDVDDVLVTGLDKTGDSKPENLLDGDQNTVVGGVYNGGREQSVTLVFKEPTDVYEIFVECKDEGVTANEDGSRGIYHLFLYSDKNEIDLGTVKAITGSDGGYTLTLDTPVQADSLKIRIDSWSGSMRACVADAEARTEMIAVIDPPTDPIGTEPDPTGGGKTEPQQTGGETAPETGDGTAVIALVSILSALGTAAVLSKKVFDR